MTPPQIDQISPSAPCLCGLCLATVEEIDALDDALDACEGEIELEED